MSRLLLVLSIRVYENAGHLFVESQAHNGLKLWLKNFDEVVLACLRVKGIEGAVLPIDTIEGRDRLRIVPLPEKWLPHQFAAAMPATVKTLTHLINEADYLHFAIGGIWGCWPSVASMIAVRLGRPFAVWTDRVESQVTRTKAKSKHGLAKLYTLINAELMRRYERMIIRKSAIGLFHGADCLEAYAKDCKRPYLVHDIHIKPAQHISANQLEARLANRGSTLRVAYAGRAISGKGVLDWIKAISIAKNRGADIAATWYGTGSELVAAQRLTAELAAPVSFPGSLPHDTILDTLKTFDIFVFCHKTLESPRCLIEALACGLPIVGYSSAYPADLISENGGGILVARDDIPNLAEQIALLQNDPAKLNELSRAARLDGQQFSDELVFSHRSEIIKTIGSIATATA